jgi:hypothetical protein
MTSEMCDYFMPRLVRRDYPSKLSDKGRADLLVNSEGEALAMFPLLNIDRKVALEQLSRNSSCDVSRVISIFLRLCSDDAEHARL